MNNKINLDALNEINDVNLQYKIITEYFSEKIDTETSSKIFEDISSVWVNYYNQEVAETAINESIYDFAIKKYKDTKNLETVKSILAEKEFDDTYIEQAIVRLEKLIEKATGKISKTGQALYGVLALAAGILIISFFIQSRKSGMLIFFGLFAIIAGIGDYMFKRQQRNTAKRKLGIE